MEIGIYVDNTWIPGIVTTNTQGLIIKYQTNNIIINFKEIISVSVDNQNFIEIFYMVMINANSEKKRILLNANNVEETFKYLTTPPVENKEEQAANRFKITETEELKNSQEFIEKQNELNTQVIKPKKKTSPIVLVIVIIFGIIFTIWLKSFTVNSKENLTSLFWVTNEEANDYFTYVFLEDKTCELTHYTSNGKIVDDCKYELNGNKIKIKFEDEKTTDTTWKIKYKIKNFKINTVLLIDGEEYISK